MKHKNFICDICKRVCKLYYEITYPVTACGLFLQNGLLFKCLIQDHISHKTLTYLENASATFLELVHIQHWSLWRFNYICECSTGGSEICNNLKEYLYFFDGICYIWMLSFFIPIILLHSCLLVKVILQLNIAALKLTVCMNVRYWLIFVNHRQKHMT